jgi:hypothetical protein
MDQEARGVCQQGEGDFVTYDSESKASQAVGLTMVRLSPLYSSRLDAFALCDSPPLWGGSPRPAALVREG